MQRRSESKRIVLECECGERLGLLGLEDDWRSERIVLRCECGKRLTLLADRIDKGRERGGTNSCHYR
jgi:hypothetical protein